MCSAAEYIHGILRKPVTLSKKSCVFIQEMERNTIPIYNTVYCIQILPLEAKLQEFKENIKKYNLHLSENTKKYNLHMDNQETTQ